MDDNVKVRNGCLDELEDVIEEIAPYRCVIITNRTLEELWLDDVVGDLDIQSIVIEDGEEYKNIDTAERIWRELIDMDISRRSLLIGLGGGVVTDLTAFVASTYMRGTYLGLLPTSLLAQVDAAIGGKTGVDLQGKNMVGTFYIPEFVLIDPDFLSTLPQEEMMNGFGEIVKYGVLDKGVHELLKDIDEVSVDEELIKRCVDVKMDIVERDLEEEGNRRVLNLGHTVGHAIEKVSDYGIKHGSAVSVGLMASALLGEELTGFDSGRVSDMLDRYGLPRTHRLDPDEMMEALRMDKKRWYDEVVFVIPEEIGSVRVTDVEKDMIMDVLYKTKGEADG